MYAQPFFRETKVKKIKLRSILPADTGAPAQAVLYDDPGAFDQSERKPLDRRGSKEDVQHFRKVGTAGTDPLYLEPSPTRLAPPSRSPNAEWPAANAALRGENPPGSPLYAEVEA